MRLPIPGNGIAPRNDASHWHLNHIGAIQVPANAATLRIGIIDTGIELAHREFQTLADCRYAEIRNRRLLRRGRAAATDSHGHGTAVAALVAGESVGALPGCSLAVCAVEVDPQDDNRLLYGSPSLSIAIEWLVHEAFRDDPAIAVVPDVIVCAQGITFDSQQLLTAVEDAINNGVVFVGAAGHPINSFTGCWYPAAYEVPPVISVGATDRNGNRWSLSAFDHDNPTVSAPGVQVKSADIGAAYAHWTGTSFATPLTGGIIARLLAANRCGPQAMKNRLEVNPQNVDTSKAGNGRGAGVVRL